MNLLKRKINHYWIINLKSYFAIVSFNTGYVTGQVIAIKVDGNSGFTVSFNIPIWEFNEFSHMYHLSSASFYSGKGIFTIKF